MSKKSLFSNIPEINQRYFEFQVPYGVARPSLFMLLLSRLNLTLKFDEPAPEGVLPITHLKSMIRVLNLFTKLSKLVEKIEWNKPTTLYARIILKNGKTIQFDDDDPFLEKNDLSFINPETKQHGLEKIPVGLLALVKSHEMEFCKEATIVSLSQFITKPIKGSTLMLIPWSSISKIKLL